MMCCVIVFCVTQCCGTRCDVYDSVVCYMMWCVWKCCVLHNVLCVIVLCVTYYDVCDSVLCYTMLCVTRCAVCRHGVVEPGAVLYGHHLLLWRHRQQHTLLQLPAGRSLCQGHAIKITLGLALKVKHKPKGHDVKVTLSKWPRSEGQARGHTVKFIQIKRPCSEQYVYVFLIKKK